MTRPPPSPSQLQATPIPSTESASPNTPDKKIPSWVKWLIALTPVFPPLYCVAFGALRSLRDLSRVVQVVLALFIVTQLVAALFTPSPLVSLVLAALRSALLVAMVSAGAYLRESRHLRPIVWGYLVVFATAWVFTLVTAGPQVIENRLAHPLYYFVSLGLLGAIALWIVVSWKGASPWWRFPAGAFALVTLLATGSRGPLLAFAVGAVAAALAGNLRYLRGIGILALIAVAAFGFIPGLRDFNPVERLATGGLSGRDQVWKGAISAFTQSPLGGQGAYQTGPFLSFLYTDRCQLTPALEQAGITCPDWLERFKGAWLIAHNVALHSLAETGVIGTAGLLTLLVIGAVAVWRTRDGLLNAVFWGFMAMNLVDVVTTLPSPHFAEFFWVVVGVAFAAWSKPRTTPAERTLATD